MSYNVHNLPIWYYTGTHKNSYYYDDTGNRIGRKIYEGANEFYLRDHTGRELALYNRNTDRLKYFNLFGNGSLGRVEVSWDSVWVEDPNHESSGYWRYSRNDYRYYYIKDHLGSIRITIDETGNVVNAQDYYSFGGILRSYNNAGGLNGERYKFTGKERDTETSYDYFGARYYDSNLGRWLTPDPLSDKYPGWSPYNYTLNNPMKYIDPDGDSVWVYAERMGSETFSNGNRSWIESIVGYLSRPDHSITRIKTDEVDKTIEFTGKGDVLFRDTDSNRLINMEKSSVEEPFPGLLRSDQSENFDFENNLLETAHNITEHKDLLPAYNFQESNCNGFANALIQSAGGKVNFSRGSYFYKNILPFAKSFNQIGSIVNGGSGR